MTDYADIPRHVAIILDGNRRWAKLRGLPDSSGHYRGMYNALWPVAEAANQQGIRYLTVYGFSTENWKRSPREVKYLMSLFERGIRNRINRLVTSGVRLRAIGQLEQLPKQLQTLLSEAIDRTAGNSGLTLTLALSYGGRQEIVKAAAELADRQVPVTESAFAGALYDPDLPDVDLLIRTSGVQRLSGFLPWQTTYAELYFTETLWPDFRPKHLQAALQDFAKRQRRFGQ